jgi:hypothetical protein
MNQFKITGTIRTSGFGHLQAAYTILYEALMESSARTNKVTCEPSKLCNTVVHFSVQGTEEQMNIFRRTNGLSEFILSPVASPDAAISPAAGQNPGEPMAVDPQIREALQNAFDRHG